MRRYLAAVDVAALAMLMTLGALVVPAQAAGTGTVSILHAVPGLTVDVYANGQKLLSNFKPGTLTKPQMLPAGSYDIKILAAGKGPTGTPAIEADVVKVAAGVNATIVAHLTAAGKPTASVYVNDVSMIAAGKARLIVRHDAAAPAVDVRANKSALLKGLTNPKQASAVVPAGTYSADVVLAGTSTVAIGPADLMLAEGTTTIVYAWGSATDENLKLAVQTISGMNGGAGVNGGEAGLAAQPEHSMPLGGIGGLVGIMLTVAALMAGCGRAALQAAPAAPAAPTVTAGAATRVASAPPARYGPDRFSPGSSPSPPPPRRVHERTRPRGSWWRR